MLQALPRMSLFAKYALHFSALVSLALLGSGGIGAYFAFEESQLALIELQREKASSAAARIEAYVRDLERQIGWLRLLQVSGNTLEQRRLDFQRLQRQVRAITEVSQIDASGKETLRVSRLSMDSFSSAMDYSADPKFTQVPMDRVRFSQVYFRKDSEPYVSVSLRGLEEQAGVTVAEVNLKLIREVISAIHVGPRGYAFVVDGSGRLIAHHDISQVLQQTDYSTLEHVARAIAPGSHPLAGRGISFQGTEVLAAYSTIEPLGWHVFVEQPLEEAYAPLHAAVMRIGFLLLCGILLSIGASLLLARRMAIPIKTLQQGAEAFGNGQFHQVIEVHTGDELEDLAQGFNAMASSLRMSYGDLERKVEERTNQLAGEKDRTHTLLLNILPEHVIQDLTINGQVSPARHEEATVMFTDFSNFTQVTSTMPAARMVAELNAIFEAFDEITHDCGVEKIKTIGDSYMAVCGLTANTSDHAQRCVSAALGMIEFMNQRNQSAAFKWEVRIGIHSGPIISGVVGRRKYAFDIWGDTVNIASRMESSGMVGRVNVSAYTFDLIQNDYRCTYRGKISAKGKGDIDMYFVDGALAPR